MANYLEDMTALIASQQMDRAAVARQLRQFVSYLYVYLEEQLAFLAANGLGAFFPPPRRLPTEDGLDRLLISVNGIELLFLPLNGVAYDQTAPHQRRFGDVPTGRLLVFVNAPGTPPLYSYWVNAEGEWVARGLGAQVVGRVEDPDENREHARNFLHDVVAELVDSWPPTEMMALNDSLAARPPIGFRVASPAPPPARREDEGAAGEAPDARGTALPG